MTLAHRSTETLRRLGFVLCCLLLAFAAACGGKSKERTSGDGGGRDGSTDGAASDGADSDATVPLCEASAKSCEDDVAKVCSADGNSVSEFECAGGCEDGICLPLRLDEGWVVHQFNLVDDGVQTAANYIFEDEGLTAIQTANPMASAYLYDTDLPASYTVTGRFSVETGSDDDLIGFVFGWQDEKQFYLVDWKKAYQDAPPCGIAEEGVALHVVVADSALTNCADLWQSAGTEKVSPLIPTTENPDGWVSSTPYDFTLRVRPGHQSFEIKTGDTVVASGTASDATYTKGKFGFYNYSQQDVRYESFVLTPGD